MFECLWVYVCFFSVYKLVLLPRVGAIVWSIVDSSTIPVLIWSTILVCCSFGEMFRGYVCVFFFLCLFVDTLANTTSSILFVCLFVCLGNSRRYNIIIKFVCSFFLLFIPFVSEFVCVLSWSFSYQILRKVQIYTVVFIFWFFSFLLLIAFIVYFVLCFVSYFGHVRERDKLHAFVLYSLNLFIFLSLLWDHKSSIYKGARR